MRLARAKREHLLANTRFSQDSFDFFLDFLLSSSEGAGIGTRSAAMLNLLRAHQKYNRGNGKSCLILSKA